MYRALLIDDEPAAIQVLKRSLAEFNEIEVVGSYNNPQQGIEAILELTPDIVFMDIEMPGLDGFMVAKATEDVPYHLVYVTAYSEHALTAFETKVVDYLMKPLRQTRLRHCLEKIKALPPLTSDSIGPKVLVSDGKTTYHLNHSDISYIESLGRYQQVNLTTSGQREFKRQTIVTEETMTSFETELSTEHFLRVHRSFIINVSLITQVRREARNTFVLMSGVSQAIPVARAKVALVRR